MSGALPARRARRLGWKPTTKLVGGRLFVLNERETPEEVERLAGNEAAEAVVAMSTSFGFWHRSWGAVAERYLDVRLRGDCSRETAYALSSDNRR
ncbi:hypothetical protein [Streptomyces atratus]|uniref:hypothetical protein n=1 Tax=Streptomyces atratus TaxID=1893 RepID=UPI0022527E0C|nr:hypothetical protein [Streptomyces atratus]MCX5342935.1 hypothetical protein [Streptomyces atratus]